MQKDISYHLDHILADQIALYIKTLNCHWNVEDPNFSALHKTFEEQYTELAEQNDLLAERIRQLGKKVAASLKEFQKKSQIQEIEGTLSAKEMIKSLIESYETLVSTCKKVTKSANEAGDDATADILIELMRSHEKTLWMLKSHLP